MAEAPATTRKHFRRVFMFSVAAKTTTTRPNTISGMPGNTSKRPNCSLNGVSANMKSATRTAKTPQTTLISIGLIISL